jgi:hypothetical protein
MDRMAGAGNCDRLGNYSRVDCDGHYSADPIAETAGLRHDLRATLTELA